MQAPLPAPSCARCPQASLDIWAWDRGEGMDTNHFRGQAGAVGSPRSALTSSWHPRVFGTRLGPFWSRTKNNTAKVMNKTQVGKLQPMQLILAEVLAAPGRCQHWDIWGVQTAGFIPNLFPALPTTRIIQQRRNAANPSTSHTHIQLNMFKPLQRLISDFIFSSSAGRACSLPSIIYAFALMNY